jgi:hypothetical protein
MLSKITLALVFALALATTLPAVAQDGCTVGTYGNMCN